MSSWPPEKYKRLLCPLCNDFLFPPKQFTCCGERICGRCNETKLQNLTNCLFCNQPEPCKILDDKGFQRELENLILNCPRCTDWFGSFKDLFTHIKNHRDLQCEYCGEKFVLPPQLTVHTKELCEKRLVACPLSVVGCSTEIRHNQLHTHCLEYQHQQILTRFVQEIYPKNSRKYAHLTLQKSQEWQYNQVLNNSIQKLETTIDETKPLLEQCSHLNSQRESYETIIQKQREESMKFKESTEKSTKLLENIKQALANLQKSLDEIKSNPIGGPKLILADNTYQWKFHFVSLNSNGQTFQSEPFQTSQGGYKLALTCSKFTDEKNKTTYLSVSLIILVGDFDPILSWPFPFPITLSLLDLSGAKNHISHMSRNNAGIQRLDRPMKNSTTSMTIARFCPISTLLEKKNNYIQDEYMFIQVQIDFMEPSSFSTNSDKERPKLIQDPIQTNILSSMPTN